MANKETIWQTYFTDLSDGRHVKATIDVYPDGTRQANAYRADDAEALYDKNNHDHDHEFAGNRGGVSPGSKDFGLVERGYHHKDTYKSQTSYPGSGK